MCFAEFASTICKRRRRVAEKRIGAVTKKEYILGAGDSLVNGFKQAINIYSGLLLTVFLKLSPENFEKVSGYLVVVQIAAIPLSYFLARLADRVKHIKRFAAAVYFPTSFLPVFLALPLAYFFPELSDNIKIAYVVVINLLINIFSTLNNNAWALMDIRLTPDDKERSYFYTIRNIIGGAVSSLGAPATWIVVFLFRAYIPFDLGVDAANAHIFFYGTLLFAVIAVPPTMWYLKARGIRIDTPPREKPENILVILKAMIRNKPLWLRRLSLILVAWGGISGSAYALLVSKYYLGITINLFGYSFVPDVATLMLIFSCTQTIPAVLSVPLALILRKRIADKTLLITTLLYAAAGLVVGYLFLTDLFFVTTLMQRFYIHLLAYCWGGLIFGFSVCGNIIDLELIDYMEWQSGQRNECTYNFILDNINKVVTLPITYIAALLLLRTGFRTDSPDMITEEATRKGLVALALLVPGVFNILGAIPLFFYKFSGETRKKILGELVTKRKGKPAALVGRPSAVSSDYNLYL